jgi:hypothetical protein
VKIEIMAQVGDQVDLAVTCPFCGQTTALSVPAAGFAAWDLGRGQHVQYAFPGLSADDRERLITGVCAACWAATFGDEEDEEDYGEPPADGSDMFGVPLDEIDQTPPPTVPVEQIAERVTVVSLAEALARLEQIMDGERGRAE